MSLLPFGLLFDELNLIFLASVISGFGDSSGQDGADPCLYRPSLKSDPILCNTFGRLLESPPLTSSITT